MAEGQSEADGGATPPACETCRAPLAKSRPWQRYCSDVCRWRGWNRSNPRARGGPRPAPAPPRRALYVTVSEGDPGEEEGPEPLLVARVNDACAMRVLALLTAALLNDPPP